MASGLFVFDSYTHSVLVLKRNFQYEKCLKWRSRPEHFIEQYFIPRGKQLTTSEPLYTCAIREFIEETKLFMKKFTLIPNTYDLTWEDPPGTIWKYTIYFIDCDLSNKNLLTISTNLDVNLMGVNFNPKQCNFSEKEEGVVTVLDFYEYEKVILKQMKLYPSSNYAGFLQYIGKLL